MQDSMVNAVVNAMYKNVGSGQIVATKAANRVADQDGNGKISKEEFKDSLKNDRVVLSLREHQEKGEVSTVRFFNSLDVATDVANKMDAADGRQDGYVDFSNKNGSGFFERLNAAFGDRKQGMFTSELRDELMHGNLVIGQEVRGRNDAVKKDFTILELHQNNKGPKITVGQK